VTTHRRRADSELFRDHHGGHRPLLEQEPGDLMPGAAIGVGLRGHP